MSSTLLQVLIVDEDAIVRESMAEFLVGVGCSVVTAASGAKALEALASLRRGGESADASHRARAVAVAIIDLTMTGISGLDFLRVLRDRHPEIVPVAITGYGTIENAVKAVRLGAMDYLTKPLVDRELQQVVERAMRQYALGADGHRVRAERSERHELDNIIGADPRMRRIYEVIQAVAPSRTTVLMSGESGTGKSLIARAIHRRSPRADKPFVEISCGSIPETLLESELFGHVKGAFTGAYADKPGRFRAAHTGTLFLDEINSASPGMQLKLLRVLQERTFEPVGSNTPIEADVRVILASNQPLEELVANGAFRQDLYYRINVVMIQLPPLRDRVGDITLLAEHLLRHKAHEAGKQIIGFTDEAQERLRRYAFPGNVRELENIIERAVVLTRRTRIEIDDLPPHIIEPGSGVRPTPANSEGATWNYHGQSLDEALEEPERQIILAALKAHDFNRQRTAEALRINRTTLYKKIKRLGLDEFNLAG